MKRTIKNIFLTFLCVAALGGLFKFFNNKSNNMSNNQSTNVPSSSSEKTSFMIKDVDNSFFGEVDEFF